MTYLMVRATSLAQALTRDALITRGRSKPIDASNDVHEESHAVLTSSDSQGRVEAPGASLRLSWEVPHD